MDPREEILNQQRRRHQNLLRQEARDKRQTRSTYYAGQDVNGQPLVRSLGGAAVPMRSLSNVQPEIGQQGRSDGQGFDVGNRTLLEERRRRQGIVNPDAKQLILIYRGGTTGFCEIWVRSQTGAVKIYSGIIYEVATVSLTSTGRQITDFIAMISGQFSVDLGQKYGNTNLTSLLRWDGMTPTPLFRGGFYSYGGVFFPSLHTVSKRGFWVSIGTSQSTAFPPPYPSGTFPSYWQIGKNSVRETTCYESPTTFNLVSDDYGTIERSTSANGVSFFGKLPIGLGTKKSGVRLLYETTQSTSRYLYVNKNGAVIGQKDLGSIQNHRSTDIDISNTCFDNQFLYEGRLNPLNLNEVIQGRYPINKPYQVPFRIDTPLDFFEIPNSVGLQPLTESPGQSGFPGLTSKDDLFVAIAFDLGERMVAGSLGAVTPDSPPQLGGGGGGI